MLIRSLLLTALLVIPLDEVQLQPATAAQVLAAVKASGAKAVVVNMWATWCIPCRAEFPELVRLYRDYRERGVALVLVSADFGSDEASVKEFLAEQGVDFVAYRKAQKDQPFIDAFDPQWTGALPATFVYDGSGALRRSILTPITYDSLRTEVEALLK